MKITDIAQLASIPKANSSQQAEQPVATADKVQAGKTKAVSDAVGLAQAAAAGSRAVKLQQLQQMVRSGGYTPDPQRIADQILDAAQVDAAMRTLLQ